jgi:hypothetical protein
MTTQLALINGETPRPTFSGRLDEHTKELGRIGVSNARAALKEANRRALERDAARLARRDAELEQKAAAARRLAANRAA